MIDLARIVPIIAISIIAYKASKEDGFKNILAFIVTVALKFYVFIKLLFMLIENYGCFSNQFRAGSEYLLYIVSYSFVIILLLFKNSLYQKLKFIFFKRTLFLAVIIYIIAISNAFYQSSNQIKQLRDDAFYNDLNITYEYNALLTSLTPRVKISFDKTYDKNKSNQIATKLFELPFNSRLEYYVPIYNSITGELINYNNRVHACFYNQKRGLFITILQHVLWLYLHIFVFHFLIAQTIVFKRKMPFINFDLIKIKKYMLLDWFLFLFFLTSLLVGIKVEFFKSYHRANHINQNIKISDTKIKGIILEK